MQRRKKKEEVRKRRTMQEMEQAKYKCEKSLFCVYCGCVDTRLWRWHQVSWRGKQERFHYRVQPKHAQFGRRMFPVRVSFYPCTLLVGTDYRVLHGVQRGCPSSTERNLMHFAILLLVLQSSVIIVLLTSLREPFLQYQIFMFLNYITVHCSHCRQLHCQGTLCFYPGTFLVVTLISLCCTPYHAE